MVRHIEGRRISIGEPDGARSARCRAIAEALIASGLRCPITTHIREEIWVKILGNVAFNPISALTGATLAHMTADPDVAALARAIMTEAECVAARLGMKLPVSIEHNKLAKLLDSEPLTLGPRVKRICRLIYAIRPSWRGGDFTSSSGVKLSGSFFSDGPNAVCFVVSTAGASARCSPVRSDGAVDFVLKFISVNVTHDRLD